MNEAVSAAAVSVKNIFLPTVELRVPSYQRSYSWTLKEAEDLLGDILEARRIGRRHFFGAMVVVCDDTRPIRSVDILDGQQRMTTLTILLAVLRDLASGGQRQSLHSLIGHSWRIKGRQRTSWRLNLARVDRLFFREVVQEHGATSLHTERAACSESRANILAVIEHYNEVLSKLSAEERSDIVDYVKNKCNLVLVKILDRSSAIDVFRVLNTRGLQLSEHNVLKSELLEKMECDQKQAESLSDIWSIYNESFGNRGFDELLKCIRNIYDPSMRGDLLVGFRKHVFSKCPSEVFIKTLLPLYADGYGLISGRKKDKKTRLNIDETTLARISFIRALEHVGWRAPVLKYLVHYAKTTEQTQMFMEGIEKLAFAMQLIVVDRDMRTRRYRRIMEAMEGDPFDADGPLWLTQEEKNRLVERLRGRINSPRQRRAISLRINAVLPGGEVLSPESDATLEHILPRHPRPDSDWMANWSLNTQRRELTDCLGNFALLTRAENQRADRGNFSDKRAVFFASGPGTYALTRDLSNIMTWTPDAVCARRDRLVLNLAGEWGLLDRCRPGRAVA